MLWRWMTVALCAKRQPIGLHFPMGKVGWLTNLSCNQEMGDPSKAAVTSWQARFMPDGSDTHVQIACTYRSLATPFIPHEGTSGTLARSNETATPPGGGGERGPFASNLW
jgi:hypothetical protein